MGCSGEVRVENGGREQKAESRKQRTASGVRAYPYERFTALCFLFSAFSLTYPLRRVPESGQRRTIGRVAELLEGALADLADALARDAHEGPDAL